MRFFIFNAIMALCVLCAGCDKDDKNDNNNGGSIGIVDVELKNAEKLVFGAADVLFALTFETHSGGGFYTNNQSTILLQIADIGAVTDIFAIKSVPSKFQFSADAKLGHGYVVTWTDGWIEGNTNSTVRKYGKFVVSDIVKGSDDGVVLVKLKVLKEWNPFK